MDTISRLTHLNIEIEGLLRTLAVRDNADIRTMLTDKYTEFHQLFESLLAERDPSPDTIAEAESALAETLTDDEVKDQEAVESEIPDEDEVAESAIEDETAKSVTPDIPSHAELLESTVVVPEPFVYGSQTVKDEPIIPVAESIDEDKPDMNEKEEINEKEDMKEKEDEDESSIPTASADIRVDEALSRREARDLRRAFTLNDKFRFRRSLFGNNDSAFADTLNTIMAMHSIDEAEEYLYNDLGWNPEDEDVKDFVSIVRNHFAGIA